MCSCSILLFGKQTFMLYYQRNSLQFVSMLTFAGIVNSTMYDTLAFISIYSGNSILSLLQHPESLGKLRFLQRYTHHSFASANPWVSIARLTVLIWYSVSVRCNVNIWMLKLSMFSLLLITLFRLGYKVQSSESIARTMLFDAFQCDFSVWSFFVWQVMVISSEKYGFFH